MNTPGDDMDPLERKAFEEYLSGQSQVSQRYRKLGGGDVPSHLDTEILKQARDALTQPRLLQAEQVDELALIRSKRRRLMHWGIPAAIAASSLLVISIVIRSGTQHAVESAQQAGVRANVPASAPVTRAQNETGPSMEEDLVLVAPAQQADSAEVRSDRLRADMERAQTKEIAAHADRAQEKLRKSSPDVSQPGDVGSISVQPSFAPAPPQPAAAIPASPDAAEAREAYNVVERPAASTPQEIAATVPEAGDDIDEIAVTGMRRATVAGSGPRDTVIAGEASAAKSEEHLETVRLRANPEEWLEHIRQLRRDDKPVAANREWQQFREQYPDYEVAETDLARSAD